MPDGKDICRTVFYVEQDTFTRYQSSFYDPEVLLAAIQSQ